MDRNRLILDITPRGTAPAGRRTVPASRLSAAILTELSRLTTRDRTILDLLADHLTFTTEQLAAVAFGSLGRARNRLGTLHDRGVLDRFRHYQRPGSQSWRWTLGPVGAAVVAAARDDPPPRPSAVRDLTARLAVSPTLTHRLAVNGFFVALLAHGRAHHGASLARWWNEARCREATGNLVRPDGHGVWVDAGRRVSFWVEVDLGTESLRRVAGKLTGYADLAGTRRAYPVLFWLPTAAREANLYGHLSRIGVPGGVTVATGAADGGDPGGCVWRVSGGAGRVSLVDLVLPTVDSVSWGE